MYDDNVSKIIQGISAAMAKSYDGATDDKGEPIKIGLRREEGDPVLDSRVMDGFGAKIQGDLLVLKYNTEENIKGLRGIHQMGLKSTKKKSNKEWLTLLSLLNQRPKKQQVQPSILN